MPECQMPTKFTLSLSTSAGQRRKYTKKGFMGEIKIGTDHSLVTVMGKTDLGKLIYYHSN